MSSLLLCTVTTSFYLFTSCALRTRSSLTTALYCIVCAASSSSASVMIPFSFLVCFPSLDFGKLPISLQNPYLSGLFPESLCNFFVFGDNHAMTLLNQRNFFVHVFNAKVFIHKCAFLSQHNQQQTSPSNINFHPHLIIKFLL